jgi:two-component system sensor kinase FixL
LVGREVSLFRSKAAALGIDLELRSPKTQPAIVNQLAVNTVLINYLQNALEAVEAGEGHRITVSVARRDKRHYIEVADDGVGVAKDVQPELFNKFTTKKTGGMGVGLYYCKMIVEAHGGEVGFKSRVSGGAQFWVEFPDDK